MENDDSESATASCLKTDFPSGGKEGRIPHDVVREVIDVFVIRCHFCCEKSWVSIKSALPASYTRGDRADIDSRLLPSVTGTICLIRFKILLQNHFSNAIGRTLHFERL